MLTINADTILKPLQAVTGIVERRHTLPILSNVLWQISPSKLSMTATDLEIQIQATIETPTSSGTQASTSETTLPARKMMDILRTLPDGIDMEFQRSENLVKIRAGKTKYNLQTLPASDYPIMAEEKKQTTLSITVDQQTLKKKLLQVQYSMATQDIRYYLNGLLIQVTENKLELVATDGHRLAYTDCEIEGRQASTQFIIPRKAITELIKLLDNAEGEIRIEKSDNQASFDLGKVKLITKLVEGTFPDYQRVIPKNYDKVFAIPRQELLNALQRAAILANEKFRGVRWVLGDKLLRLACTNAEQEEAEEEMEVDYHHEAMDIGFNINYLLDVLNNTKADTVNCALGDENSSMLITIPKEQSFKYVVMPMKI